MTGASAGCKTTLMTNDVGGDRAQLHVDGPVATVALGDPRKRNALGLQSWRALPELIEHAECSPAVRVIVVRGNGGLFGAGNDIAELAALDTDAAMAFACAMVTAAQAVEAAAKPVVMAIEGACYGGSVALALAGDLRVASSDAVFAITPAKLGLVYLRSDLQRLVAAIGMGQSKRLIYTAEAIDAARALAIGLVDEVFAAVEFEAGLARLTHAIAAGSPFTLHHTKDVLRGVGDGHATPETQASLAPFAEATQGADFKEGSSAFLSRRAPRFG